TLATGESSGEDANIPLESWINLETIGKLSTESRHLDGVAESQAANVDARRCGDKGMHFSTTIVDEYYEASRQNILYGLRNRLSYPDQLALGRFAHLSSGDRQRFNCRPPPMNFGFCYIYQN